MITLTIMVTIKDVAEKAGVSLMTVSRALNKPELLAESTRKRIQQVMDELGYRPNLIARSLVSKTSTLIGVIMPDITNSFFNAWFRVIEDIARAEGYNLLLCNTDEDPRLEMEYADLLMSYRAAGIIIIPRSHEVVNHLRHSKAKFVLVDRYFEESPSAYISTNHYRGAVIGTEYLLERGHRNITVLTGPNVLVSGAERNSGFLDTCEKYDHKPNLENMLNCDYAKDIAFERLSALLKRGNLPTAIFSFNSLMTLGAIQAIDQAGLVIPDDISLLGFDPIPAQGIVKPGISYIGQDVEKIGNGAINMLIEIIRGNSKSIEENQLQIEPELFEFDSVRRVQ